MARSLSQPQPDQSPPFRPRDLVRNVLTHEVRRVERVARQQTISGQQYRIFTSDHRGRGFWDWAADYRRI